MWFFESATNAVLLPERIDSFSVDESRVIVGIIWSKRSYHARKPWGILGDFFGSDAFGGARIGLVPGILVLIRRGGLYGRLRGCTLRLMLYLLPLLRAGVIGHFD